MNTEQRRPPWKRLDRQTDKLRIPGPVWSLNQSTQREANLPSTPPSKPSSIPTFFSPSFPSSILPFLFIFLFSFPSPPPPSFLLLSFILFHFHFLSFTHKVESYLSLFLSSSLFPPFLLIPPFSPPFTLTSPPFHLSSLPPSHNLVFFPSH